MNIIEIAGAKIGGTLSIIDISLKLRVYRNTTVSLSGLVMFESIFSIFELDILKV